MVPCAELNPSGIEYRSTVDMQARHWMFAAVLAVAACGPSGHIEKTTTSEPEPAAAEATTTTAVTAPKADTSGALVSGAAPGVGVAVSKSDVSGIDDSRLVAGTVLFVPAAGFEALSDIVALDPAGLPYANFTVGEEELGRLAAFAVPVSEAGEFRTPAEAGAYVVCLADVFPDHTRGAPYAVVGCATVELAANASLTVSFGEGGVEVSPD